MTEAREQGAGAPDGAKAQVAPEGGARDRTPPKSDPEAFALRARPARTIRFRTRAIIALAAAGSLGIAVVSAIALRSSLPDTAAPIDLGAKPPQPDEAVRALPASYDNVAKLGPPLPGDLGKPILDRQRALQQYDDHIARVPIEAIDTARSEELAEQKAALRSGLLVKSGAETGSVTRPRPDRSIAGGAPGAPAAAPDDGMYGGGVVDPHRLVPAASPYLLSAGSVIAASLITGLDSDLPGLVTAQVTERVFDSATGRIELVPQGARLIGRYDSDIAYGQRRARILWQRIVMPGGSSLAFGDMAAADPSGKAGLEGRVDGHGWTLLKGVLLSTLLGAGSSLDWASQSELARALRQSAQMSGARAGDQLVGKSLSVQPTIKVSPGTPVRLIVERDLVLSPPVQGDAS